MEALPKQPERKKPELQGASTALHRLTEWLSVPEEPTVSSIGELILPYLLGAMQACWIAAILIGLASSHIFESTETLIPLWAPFFIIPGSLFLFHYLGLRTSKNTVSNTGDSVVKVTIPETTLFIIVLGVLSLFFVWLYLYTQIAFFFGPKWLLTFFSDTLFLNGHFYIAVSIIGLVFLLGWLGIRLINRNIEPSDAFRALCIGLGVFIVVIILRTGQASAGAIIYDDEALLLLIPLFLFLALMAHALARVVFIRKSHPTGLQGSIVAQERAIIFLIALLGLAFLLIALVIGGTIDSASLANVQYILAALKVGYNWLVGIIAAILVIPIIPIFWLISLLPRPTQPSKGTRLHHVQNTVKPDISAWQTTFVHVVIPILSIVMPILVISFLAILIRWTLHRRQRVRKRVNKRNQDIHESLWSWSLFWMQLKSMLLALFARFLHHDTETEDGSIIMEEIQGEPAARSIREMYRALLKKAARQGYPRRKFETPYEFQQRLDEKFPLTEPQLGVITEAYASTRYGGDVPNEAQVAQVRSNWVVLDQNWT